MLTFCQHRLCSVNFWSGIYTSPATFSDEELLPGRLVQSRFQNVKLFLQSHIFFLFQSAHLLTKFQQLENVFAALHLVRLLTQLVLVLRISEGFRDLLCYFLTFCVSWAPGQHVFCEVENISSVDVRQFVSYCLKSLFKKLIVRWLDTIYWWSDKENLCFTNF